jgi:hypothetical protein
MILVLWDDRDAIVIPRTTGLFSRLFKTPRARFSGNKENLLAVSIFRDKPWLFYEPKFARVDLVPDHRGRSSSDIDEAKAAE